MTVHILGREPRSPTGASSATAASAVPVRDRARRPHGPVRRVGHVLAPCLACLALGLGLGWVLDFTAATLACPAIERVVGR